MYFPMCVAVMHIHDHMKQQNDKAYCLYFYLRVFISFFAIVIMQVFVSHPQVKQWLFVVKIMKFIHVMLVVYGVWNILSQFGHSLET